MITIMGVIVLLSVIFWVICETISAIVGIIFIVALMLLIKKLWKDVDKK